MKVALIGYGKMGKEIESILLERGHEIAARFGKDGIVDKDLAKADVAVEFSRPESAYGNILNCINLKIPVIIGTTGWLDQYQEVCDKCLENGSALLYASNFSLGVNIFFEINKKLATMMNSQKDYKVGIEEIHHTQKLDAPSGTAISLAEQIWRNAPRWDSWTMENEVAKNEIPIVAKRIEAVPGTHIIEYKSIVDSLEIKHTAHNRKGFALGAAVAAEFILGKQGIYKMKDLLKF